MEAEVAAVPFRPLNSPAQSDQLFRQLLEAAPDGVVICDAQGRIVFSNAHEIAIRRHDDQAGEVVVHFPRAGFTVVPAGH